MQETHFTWNCGYLKKWPTPFGLCFRNIGLLLKISTEYNRYFSPPISYYAHSCSRVCKTAYLHELANLSSGKMGSERWRQNWGVEKKNQDKNHNSPTSYSV